MPPGSHEYLGIGRTNILFCRRSGAPTAIIMPELSASATFPWKRIVHDSQAVPGKRGSAGGRCGNVLCRIPLAAASVDRHLSWQYGCVPRDSDRSLARIEIADLLRLAALAADAEAELFRRNPQGSGRYAGRLLGRALCQGAALHYVNGITGVKDFDVWSFYAQDGDWPFPARWRGTRDFGPSKFGRYRDDPPRYSGRRVDLLGRSLRSEPGVDLADVLRCYLAARRTASAKALAANAVVLIDPENRAGEIVWPAH